MSTVTKRSAIAIAATLGTALGASDGPCCRDSMGRGDPLRDIIVVSGFF